MVIEPKISYHYFTEFEYSFKQCRSSCCIQKSIPHFYTRTQIDFKVTVHGGGVTLPWGNTFTGGGGRRHSSSSVAKVLRSSSLFDDVFFFYYLTLFSPLSLTVRWIGRVITAHERPHEIMWQEMIRIPSFFSFVSVKEIKRGKGKKILKEPIATGYWDISC